MAQELISCAGANAAPKGQGSGGAKAGKKVAANKASRSGFLWAQCTAWFKQACLFGLRLAAWDSSMRALGGLIAWCDFAQS